MFVASHMLGLRVIDLSAGPQSSVHWHTISGRDAGTLVRVWT